MPTYQYQCETCGIVFEKKQHFTDEPIKDCPECSGPVHRVMQPVGIIFKGSGFYVTDNKKAASSTLPRSTNREDAKSSTTDTKTEVADTSSTDTSATSSSDTTKSVDES